MVVLDERVSIPERTLDQRMAALDRANDIRSRRAQLKRDLKASRLGAAEVLLDPPEWALTMRVLDLLLAAPKVGRVKASRLVNSAKLSPVKTLGGLTARQRGELVATLRGRR